MKNILSLILMAGTVFAVGSCNSISNQKKNTIDQQGGEFDWLVGNWLRLNEEADKTTYENWEKSSSNGYVGIGFTMHNSDTIKQERMQIEKMNGAWILTVKVPEEKESIPFPITQILKDEFVCKNDSLDFPRTIKYWKEGDRIRALVAGDSLKINFEFERLK